MARGFCQRFFKWQKIWWFPPYFKRCCRSDELLSRGRAQDNHRHYQQRSWQERLTLLSSVSAERDAHEA
ncbi:MAG: hypothetical protein ACFB4I_01295 [Cyanophyceae cyanobacterium]